MAEKNNILSLSGGKDSTAAGELMIERGEKIHSAVFFDTSWEFPAMYPHIDLFEKRTGIKVVRLTPERTFDYWMYERPAVARKGPNKGKVHRIGNGWPSPMRRWCTRQKIDAIDKYLKTIENPVSCIGFAHDEQKRIGSVSAKKRRYEKRYPLVEYGVTEAEALKYCRTKGYHWGGLYDHFSRVSCFCCPLQKIGDLRILRKYFPDLWSRMLEMDSSVPGHNRGFKDYKTVHDFERRFAFEDRQMDLFPEMAVA
ncbi:MAG: phosphoadenosine phosphosulfate reductase family protein [Desulfobacteraceae bacterium]|nr:phosphoadenosine phosphosulfate reductase family protein [Desulfobacteraceae bacterium]